MNGIGPSCIAAITRLPAQDVPFSPVVMVTLLMVLSASVTMFWVLCRRATTDRQIVGLWDWAREKKFRLRGTNEPCPPLIAGLTGPDGGAPQVRLCMGDEKTHVVQFQTAPATHRADFESPFSSPALFPGGRNEIWQVIIRHVELEWRPTGLRPAAANASLLDLFALSVIPRMGDPERLVVCGADPETARALSLSIVVALLPPDVGLLLHGRQIALDFSTRPFDVIEFNRMLALMDQIAAHLPELS